MRRSLPGRRWSAALLGLIAATLFAALSEPRARADSFAETVAAQAADAAYEEGDHTAAAAFWHELAEDGDAIAQFNLGLLYETGRGVPADPEAAAGWYERAALQGVPSAQINLGALYFEGRGLPQDLERAFYWLEVAANGTDDAARDEAAQAAATVASLLDETGLEAVRAEARAFAPRTEPRMGGGPAQETPSGVSLSNAQIAKLQRGLAALGYDAGPADGVPGDRTRQALHDYLKDRAIEWASDGHITQRLFDLVVQD